MLIKASVASRKLSAGFFCLFVVLSMVLILLSVSIIVPLGNNIENKINNHIYNRELVIEYERNIPDDFIEGKLDEVKKVEGVTAVYRMPAKLMATEQSGTLSDMYHLSYLHSGFTPIITSGRAFEESETQVALVPQHIKDYNSADGKFYQIEGETLIGKTLVFADECDNAHKVTVVGAYSTVDPIFSGDEILIPQADLLEYDEKVIKDSLGTASIRGGKNYIILFESARSAENAMEEISKINNRVSQNNTGLDADSYNIALVILLAALVFFVALVIAGLYMFLKNNISSRTNELALYRSLGYKSKHLFSIIFYEHLFFGVLSLALGVAVAVLLNHLVVNPYLFSLVGNTIMEMTVSVAVWQVACIAVFFLVILLIVCRSAVKRSEKIDLTVLLRER